MKYNRIKPKKYRIYFQKRTYKWKPTRKILVGWRYTKRGLDWFKSKGIRAHAKRIK